MGRIISQNLIPKKVLDFLQDHQHQISAENFTGWFKGSSQADFDVAEGACQVLKAAGVPPFADASEGEVTYACSWTWQNGHNMGIRLGSKVQYRPQFRANHLAPLLAALGNNVYEFQDSVTGEVDWMVLPPHRELKETLKYLLQDRVVTNFSLSDYVKIDQNARY